MRFLRQALKRTPIYPVWKKLGWYPDYLYWKMRGEPRRSPHLVKQRAVREHAERFGLRTLVETGTYYGEMIDATKDFFSDIYSVELDPFLVKVARRRFGYRLNVHIIQGDSQTAVPELLKTLKSPALFWLDAGYYGWAELKGNSGRLTAELEAILAHPVRGHVVLMDDARGFDGQNGAPTLEQLREYIAERRPDLEFEMKQDIIRIFPA